MSELTDEKSEVFLWLHIKKCAGQSFRNSFSPPYTETNRKKAKPFIALSKSEWNDALNNYRIPLGEYDFKRMLFAKKFLYSESEFQKMYKFTIVRNPYDRIVSLWKYLMNTTQVENSLNVLQQFKGKHSFSTFIDYIPMFWEADNFRSFKTHTAPIWNDLTDENGNLLVDDIFKIEEINKNIEYLSKKIGLEKTINFSHINKSKHASYKKYYNLKLISKVEKLYGDDIEKLGYEY